MMLYITSSLSHQFRKLVRNMYLTAIDKSTRLLKAVSLRNKEASTCTDAFLANWVPRFGVADTVQFTSAIGTSNYTRLGNQHLLTTALPSSLRSTG